MSVDPSQAVLPLGFNNPVEEKAAIRGRTAAAPELHSAEASHEPVSPTASALNPPTIEVSASSAAGTWYAQLGPEERTVAASFEDGPLVRTLFRLGAPDVQDDGKRNWLLGTMVSLEEFTRAYEANSPKTTTPKVANRKSTETSDTKADDVILPEEVESTAFRIHHGRIAKTILEDAAIIFPSATEHVTGAAGEAQIVVRSRDSTNLVTVLEEARRQTLDLDTSSFDDKNHVPWIQRLRTNRASARIPLSAYILTRLEWAIWESFHSTLTSSDFERRVRRLRDILCHAQALRDMALMVNSSSSPLSFMKPVVDVCGPQGPQSGTDLIKTPLLQLTTGRIDYDKIDQAVGQSLQVLKGHGIDTSDGGDKNALVLATAVELSLLEEEDKLKDASSNKKRKKKNKKRKKNKGAATNGSSADASTVHATTDAQTETGHVDASPAKAVKESEEEKSMEQKEDTKAVREGSSTSPVPSIPETTSIVSDDTSFEAERVLLQNSKHAFVSNTEHAAAVAQSDTDGIVSRPAATVEGIPPTQSTATNEKKEQSETDDAEGGDEWETVEVRVRSGRKKPVDRFHSSKSASNSSGHMDHHQSQGKKPKSVRASTQRKKNSARKLVRDILHSIIDTVEDESRRKKLSIRATPRTLNSWNSGPPGANLSPTTLKKDFASIVSSAPRLELSKRSVATGTERPLPTSSIKQCVGASNGRPDCGMTESQKAQDSLPRRLPESPKRKASLKRGKSQTGVLADQNTAPTYQETVSAISNASSMVRPSLKEESLDVPVRKSDMSSGESNELRPSQEATNIPSKVVGSPPLPTLLSPENANSASSSVASSLEASCGVHVHRHAATAVDVNDVGYHLLDVCDRLSRDMSLFMSRRALALNARRRERGALLAALQNSVSSIWPGRCHVELYGSCATQLDLPSSDLDVVVLGLDRTMNMSNSSAASCSSVNKSKPRCTDTGLGSVPTKVDSSSDLVTQKMGQSKTPYGILPSHRNSERVMRLTADLEKKVWAVQVNAIPTASVPVIKVLADPSKLLGAANGGWMAQHERMAAQAAAAAGVAPVSAGEAEQQGSFRQPTRLPWRGSDVVKGLLSLDITFEGPEHGGIGSTEFSARAVAEACAESDLHPEATPFVQVVMVLKEILAQRKLNEPYSGGLSSYALLLLVVALVRERVVIREEIERVEQQRKAMDDAELSTFATTTEGCSAFGSSPSSLSPQHCLKTETSAWPTEAKPSAVEVKTPLNSNPQHIPQESSQPPAKLPTNCSWANVAKKSPGTKGKGTLKREPLNAATQQKPSFADAVARSMHVAGEGRKPVPKGWDEVGKLTKGQRNVAANSEQVSPDKVSSRSPGHAAKSSRSSGTLDSNENSTPPGTSSRDGSVHVAPPFCPQGYNDIVEVLCSGETTAGKLLMHFLLYYGQHFDAQTAAIDISGKHERDMSGQASPYSYISPYIQRRTPGSIDPVTGMLTVDPIVIYDPLEGAENNNVSRRCFAWNSVRWIFAQSYSTLASAVERCATPPATPGGTPVAGSNGNRDAEHSQSIHRQEDMGDLMDPSSPLLRCLLSF